MTDGAAGRWDAGFRQIPIEDHRRAVLALAPSRYSFPDAHLAAGDGPAAAGADFEPSTVLAAYRAGYFPWPNDSAEYLWFSPDPRAIIPEGGLQVSRRLARTLRQGRFRVSLDAAFAEVLSGCAEREEGTWITPAYARGYTALYQLGRAHSFEVWLGDELAGGLYGVRCGRMFGAESMFHRVTDASKVAMVALMQWAEREGITLVDVQVATPHTMRMGAVEISRDDYLARLREATR